MYTKKKAYPDVN